MHRCQALLPVVDNVREISLRDLHARLRPLGCSLLEVRQAVAALAERFPTDGIGTPDPHPRNLVNQCF